MKLAPRLLICTAIVSSSFASATEPNRSPLTNQLRSLVYSVLEAPPQTEQLPSYPLVIRVQSTAIASQAGDRVNTTQPVSCVVLGTPATGTSWTRGTIRVDTSSAQRDADFVVTFRGESFSRTVGVQGPARIHSHSVTDFVVSRHVTFSPLQGFAAQRTSVNSKTRLTMDEVQSTKPGLRGALVRRIGSRRANRSQREAEKEVTGHVRRQLIEAFDQELDQRVADLNRQLQIARYARVLFGNADQLSVRVCSADDCVQIAIGAKDDPQPENLFPATPADSPLEVWLHEASVQEQSKRLAGPLALLSASASTLPALQTISSVVWLSQKPTGIDIQSKDGWLILSFDSAPANAEVPETRLARHSAN